MAFCGPQCCNANNDDTVALTSKAAQADPTSEAVETRPVKVLPTAAATETAAAATEKATPAPAPKLADPPKALPTAEVTPIVQAPTPAPVLAPAPEPAKITTWVYKPFNDKVIDIRKRATLSVDKEDKAGFRMAPDEVFEVSEELKSVEDGEDVLFLKLADGRGWVFDKRPRKGMMCIRQEDLHKLPPPAAALPEAVQAPPPSDPSPGPGHELGGATAADPPKKDKGCCILQ